MKRKNKKKKEKKRKEREGSLTRIASFEKTRGGGDDFTSCSSFLEPVPEKSRHRFCHRFREEESPLVRGEDSTVTILPRIPLMIEGKLAHHAAACLLIIGGIYWPTQAEMHGLF